MGGKAIQCFFLVSQLEMAFGDLMVHFWCLRETLSHHFGILDDIPFEGNLTKKAACMKWQGAGRNGYEPLQKVAVSNNLMIFFGSTRDDPTKNDTSNIYREDIILYDPGGDWHPEWMAGGISKTMGVDPGPNTEGRYEPKNFPVWNSWPKANNLMFKVGWTCFFF